MAAPAEREGGSEHDQDDRSRDERPPRRPPRQRYEHRVAGQEDEDAASVGAELTPADGHERKRCDCRDGPAAENRGARERRNEQQRREQVREPVEARVLRRPEGREGDPAGVDSHRDQIRRQDAREQEAVPGDRQPRECDSRRCEQHDHRHVDPHMGQAGDAEREVRQQDPGEGRQYGPTPEDREPDDQRQRDEQNGRLCIAVLIDAAVEREQRGGGIASRCRAKLPVGPERRRRDVHDRHEAGNPRGVGRQQAVEPRRKDSDPVAGVIGAATGRREAENDRRIAWEAARVGDVDQRPAGGSALQERVPHGAAPQRRERTGAARLRAGIRHQEPLCAVVLERLERLGRNDDYR